jgi:hypothetical protein
MASDFRFKKFKKEILFSWAVTQNKNMSKESKKLAWIDATAKED